MKILSQINLKMNERRWNVDKHPSRKSTCEHVKENETYERRENAKLIVVNRIFPHFKNEINKKNNKFTSAYDYFYGL